jgi:hypothetical protein
MTSGGLTKEEALRLQNIEPGAPGPVTDQATIATLIDVAFVLLTGTRPEATFTFEEIAAELRSCLDEGQTIDDGLIRSALENAPLAVPVAGGWQWR